MSEKELDDSPGVLDSSTMKNLPADCPSLPENLPATYFKVWIFVDPNKSTFTDYWAALVDWKTGKVDCQTWRWIPQRTFPCILRYNGVQACGRAGYELMMWEKKPWGTNPNDSEKIQEFLDSKEDEESTVDNPP